MKQQTQTKDTNNAVVTTALFKTTEDVKTAILIVSVLANIAFFTIWLVLRLTPRYDAVMTTWLFG